MKQTIKQRKRNAAEIELEQHEPGLPDSPPSPESISGPSGFFTPPKERSRQREEDRIKKKSG